MIVYRIDRLGRSPIDVLNSVNHLRETGINVRSIQDGIDPATSTGQMILNMLATLAECERELITEPVNAGATASKAAGTRSGPPPVDQEDIADKLAIAADVRVKGRTAGEAARRVGVGRRHRHRAAANPYPSPRG